MNRPITYKHLLGFGIVIGLIFAVKLEIHSIRGYIDEWHHNIEIDAHNEGYELGFKAGVQSEKDDEAWRKTCSLAKQKKDLELLNSGSRGDWFVVGWCPNP